MKCDAVAACWGRVCSCHAASLLHQGRHELASCCEACPGRRWKLPTVLAEVVPVTRAAQCILRRRCQSPDRQSPRESIGGQVTKAGAAGEVLSPGAFAVKGARHFLPPHPLVMGLGFLFVLDAASVAGHAGERAVKSAEAPSPVQEGTGARRTHQPSLPLRSANDGATIGARVHVRKLALLHGCGQPAVYQCTPLHPLVL